MSQWLRAHTACVEDPGLSLPPSPGRLTNTPVLEDLITRGFWPSCTSAPLLPQIHTIKNDDEQIYDFNTFRCTVPWCQVHLQSCAAVGTASSGTPPSCKTEMPGIPNSTCYVSSLPWKTPFYFLSLLIWLLQIQIFVFSGLISLSIMYSKLISLIV